MSEKSNNENGQGFANDETWCVHAWLTDNLVLRTQWRQHARQAVQDVRACQSSDQCMDDIIELATLSLAEQLETALRASELLATPSLHGDLLSAALDKVNWEQVAAPFVREAAAPAAGGPSHFGHCPECGQNDGYLNVGRAHWFICHTHRTRWCAGGNLFSSWREETEADWERNAGQIEDYIEVEPLRRE